MKFHICSLFALSTLLPFFTAIADSLWIESESIARKPDVAEITEWTRPELLSGGHLLAVNLDAKKVESHIPPEGIELAYPLTAQTSGTYTLWNRVVFENIRAPFEWRINGGPWERNSQLNQPVTNVQELSNWNPVGWTRMGSAELKAGENLLEIRLTRQPKDPQKPQGDLANLRYVSDVIHFTTNPDWQPNFQYAPGTDFQNGRDREAANTRFTLKDTPEARDHISLDGLWQYAPYDEIGEITEASRVSGTADYPDPDQLSWYGLPVPSNRNEASPDTRWSHRFVLRTTVDIPASMKNSAFVLEFEALNLIQTLFVNGKRIGDFDVVKSRWQVDISSAIEPGKPNEILLVVKDTYYALSVDNEGLGLRRIQYFPNRMFNRNQGITNRFDFPVAFGHQQTGILDSVTLTATETPVYIADTFVKPFPITEKSIDFDATLQNAGSRDQLATLRMSIQSWPDAQPLLEVGETTVQVPAGASATATLQTPSDPLTLWWTYDATLYTLVSEILIDGQVVDRQQTRFGNREWEIRGNQFYLNGVRQHLRSDLTHINPRPEIPKEKILADWKAIGTNMFRRRFQFPWNGLSPRDTLNWMDEAGMPVRMNAGTFDGQVAPYRLVEGDRNNRHARRMLFDRWHAQMMNGVDTFKNHPSVFIWELDNELVYINARNFGLLDEVEPEFSKMSHDILAFDPTRSTVTGGGSALRDQSLPTYGIHYFEDADRHYPDEAYTGEISLPREGTTRSRVWPVDFDKKPIFFSETAFLPGRNPAQFASFGGETTFLGKSEAKPAIGLYASWIAEGYRWKGYAANHVWFAKDFTDGAYTYAWQPVAILRREWNDTFAPGQQVSRELRVYNDLPDTRPISASWSLELDGKIIQTGSKTFEVAPGSFKTWNIQFTLPASAPRRTEGRLTLNATRADEVVFTHDLPVTLLPDPKPVPAPINGELWVWDPEGETLARLQAAGYSRIHEARSFAEIPDQFGLLVVGRNALSLADATSRRWTALAAAGNKILFFEQEHPLHFQGIPADVEPTDYDGRMAFSQNLSHPIFSGLAQADLSLWAGDHVVYRNALRKPSRGATSLVQVDDELGCSAMLEVPIEQGLLLMSQMAVSEKLETEVVARRLFDNLVHYAATYQRVTRQIETVVSNPTNLKALHDIGVSATENSDPVASLKANPRGIVIVEGTAENLTALAEAPREVETFTQSGGYLLLLDITPDSLQAFNQLVGYDHVLRPFREERVRFPAVRNPLTAGLTLPDVVMSSGRRIQSWNRDEWPTNDAFDYIVDLKDIAPFSTFPTPAELGDHDTKGPGTDRWLLNMVNGYTSSTHWRMVYTIWTADPGPRPLPITLPREEIITGLTLTPSRTYNAITKIRLVFDDNPDTVQEIEIGPEETTRATLNPQSARKVTLEILDWTRESEKTLVGIDNLELFVERPADFDQRVRPMLNIGGLIAYPRGKGGMILNQYVFRANEANPVNADKKKTLLSTLLKNMGGDLGGAKTAVAGFNLQYTPLPLDGSANLYLSKAQGWSAKGGDLSALPKGPNTFADVRYLITDFSTSPLESGVTLKHPKLSSNAGAEIVTGIPVNGPVDTLFFLHTFLETRSWKPRRATDSAPELFQYIIHYEDGSEARAVITLNDGVANWLQPANARPLARADIAWTGPAIRDRFPTVYQYQWNNPFPARKVTSVDLAYAEKGKDFGAPVLLGLTAGQVRE
ncbi:glycoside hydrolase family 2 TIM barrel-domain containing protein [Kiritimatiellaeota bacterium B1221]|nr:glycoside hydrolase family 2 TIM barrel-domain containing protein [Kiritimatiellaeota bacterium B1221]